MRAITTKLRTRRHKPAAAETPPKPTPQKPVAPKPAASSKPVVLRNVLSRDDGTKDAGVWVHFLIQGHDQQYADPDARVRAYSDQMFRWADLAGHRIWLNCVRNPFNVDAYVSTLMRRDHLEPKDGTRSWDELVASASEVIRRYDSAMPVTTLGVRISDTPVPGEQLKYIAESGPIPDGLSHLAEVRSQRSIIESAVARTGWEGRPLTGPEMEWVIHANRALGFHTPALVTDLSREFDNTWRTVDGFTGVVHATAGDYSPTVRLTATRDLTEVVRHVVVQPVSLFEDRKPEAEPWLGYAATLDDENVGPVGYTLIGEVKKGDELLGTAAKSRRRAESAVEGFTEMDARTPPAMERALKHAVTIEDEVTNGSDEVAARFTGVALFATGGETADEALSRGRHLRDRMRRDQRVTLSDAYGQYNLYRAFTPGAAESASDTVTGGFQTRQPLYYLATAGPNAYASASDPDGMPLGPVGGSTELFLYDPHSGPSNNESGLSAWLGMQGAGKSSVVGALIDWSVAQGHQNVFTDPAGTMRRLCDLPWNRADSFVFDLGKAAQGVAVPSLLVPEPRRSDYPSGADYATAVAEADAARVDAQINVFRELLPHQVLMSEPDVSTAIETAVTERGTHYGADPWELVAHMEQDSTAGARAARLLRVRGGKSVFFPAPGGSVDREASKLWDQFGNAKLIGISLQGIEVPEPGTPRELWTREQQRSSPLLLVSSLLAFRVMYADKRSKGVTVDEIGITAAGGNGSAAMLRRAGVESRKHGATVNIVGQTPSMLTSLGDQVSSLVGFAAVGMMDTDTAKECLPLLGMRRDSGYEHDIAGLNPGEFLIRRAVRSGPDGRNRRVTVRRVYVERDWWHPELLAALDTTPEGAHDDRDKSAVMFR